MIEQTLKDQIKTSLNIVDLIGQYVTLKRAGKHYLGVCPFHDDHKPSMVVSPHKESYYCPACDAKGDIFEFIKEFEKVTFPEAVRRCAERAGIQFESKELTPAEVEKAKEKEATRVAVNASSLFFEKNLPLAEGYLAGRGYSLTDGALKDYRIGYAPNNNELLKTLKGSGYDTKYLEMVNVIAKSERGYYDVFRDRIMFPYIDLNGNVIGFSGRFVTPKENIGKYVNTSETPLFTKGNNLFGLYQAKKAISDKDNVYLVEGQFDVLSIAAAGVKNIIAGGGTALTKTQIKMILRFTRNVTLVYDADKAGLKAALKHCATLLEAGANVRCIALPEGKDPDNLAQEEKENTGQWLVQKTIDFVSYFTLFLNKKKEDPVAVDAAFTQLCELVAFIPDDSLRSSYIRKIADYFFAGEVLQVKKKVHSFRTKLVPKEGTLKPGIYGIEELKELNSFGILPRITASYEDYLEGYGEEPIILIHGKPSSYDIQQLRSVSTAFAIESEGLVLEEYRESTYLASIAELYRGGITDIKVTSAYQLVSCDEDDDEEKTTNSQDEYSFLDYYIRLHREVLDDYPLQKPNLIDRCAELISYASDSARTVSSKSHAAWLGLNVAQYKEILKPFLDKRKSRIAINSQRDSDEEFYDPDTIPDYVEENPEYKAMYRDYGYYPRINKDGEPVGYMFKNDKGGHTLVADFYMEPLLHIKDPEPENNKRIFKVSRRFYKTPLYMSFKSTSLLKKSSFEEVIILEEALNFDNGEEKHWSKIKSCMSRKYTTCRELKIYGQQSEDFYAFANGIFHEEDGVTSFEKVTDLGTVAHKGENYFLPAFSSINSNRSDDDKFETLRYFVYKDIPIAQQCSFGKWATLMDEVYKVNENGKWATIYAIMCAFRSDIHSIDRLFTALFFMGPTMSGKTQIAISVRSLFITPDMPAFNLNTGSDAAFSTLMGSYRDVPAVLEEYNNKDISDGKFQALKAITYDGDGRQKRKGTSGREIEIDKVYTPVVISGQETPQRDDNALMNRVIVCEVPKVESRTDEEIELFQSLKQVEKNGLSNILVEVLQLRPIIRKNFKTIHRSITKELTNRALQGTNASGDMVRIINTVSLLLTTCKIVEDFAPKMKLPFTYLEFFEIAAKKVIFQVELISHTDKLATFFKAMDAMINVHTLKEGREFLIDVPGKLTVKLSGGETKEIPLPAATKVLYLRMSSIFPMFVRSSFNNEEATQSTLEQNLRSNPAYLGFIKSKRFTWKEVDEVPRRPAADGEAGIGISEDNRMERIVKKQSQISSCIALNYDIFRSFYDVDLERNKEEEAETEEFKKLDF